MSVTGMEDTVKSSVRNLSCTWGFSERRSKVQVRLREDVSEPANMNVLMLWRMSVSEIRWSEGSSTAVLDFTRGRMVRLDYLENAIAANTEGSANLCHQTALRLPTLALFSAFSLE